jgi:hypothetical protein
MNTLIVRPAVIGSLPLRSGSERRCRGSILASQPRFRILRFVHARAIHGLHHSRLSLLLRRQWHIMRSHSSWSRA